MKTSLCALSLVLASQLLGHAAFAQKEPTRDQIDQQLVEMNEIIANARLVPEMRDGQRVGFKRTRIEAKNENYEKAGMQESGVINAVNIQSINGEAISNESTAQ